MPPPPSADGRRAKCTGWSRGWRPYRSRKPRTCGRLRAGCTGDPRRPRRQSACSRGEHSDVRHRAPRRRDCSRREPTWSSRQSRIAGLLHAPHRAALALPWPTWRSRARRTACHRRERRRGVRPVQVEPSCRSPLASSASLPHASHRRESRRSRPSARILSLHSGGLHRAACNGACHPRDERACNPPLSTATTTTPPRRERRRRRRPHPRAPPSESAPCAGRSLIVESREWRAHILARSLTGGCEGHHL